MNTVNWQEIKKDLLELIPKLSEFSEDEEIKNYLENLREIKLLPNDEVSYLPESIKYLKNLEILSIEHYFIQNKLQKLDNIYQLTNLTELHITNGGYLTTIPESIKYLKNLRILDLSLNGNLSFLPQSIGELKNLQILNLMGCNQIKSLPDSICDLENLEELNLSGFDYFSHFYNNY